MRTHRSLETPDTGYVVTVLVGGVAQRTIILTGTTTSDTVTGLKSGTAYTFTVAATNARGSGPASAASSSITPT